jgi:hypothetical protein
MSASYNWRQDADCRFASALSRAFIKFTYAMWKLLLASRRSASIKSRRRAQRCSATPHEEYFSASRQQTSPISASSCHCVLGAFLIGSVQMVVPCTDVRKRIAASEVVGSGVSYRTSSRGSCAVENYKKRFMNPEPRLETRTDVGLLNSVPVISSLKGKNVALALHLLR